MTIVPGFIDCHNHAPGVTLMYDVLVGNPYEVEFVAIDSIVDKLRAKAKDAAADTWVEGSFFDGTKVRDKRDKRALNVHDLDRVSKDCRWRFITAVGIRRFTTERHWQWRASPSPHRRCRAVLSIAMPPVN